MIRKRKKIAFFFKIILPLLLTISIFISFIGCGCWNLEDSKLPAPSNLEVIKGDFEVTITWNNVAEANYYNLYYSINNEKVTKENAIMISNVTSPYFHKNLSADIYCYVITSANEKSESLASDKICVDGDTTNGIIGKWDNTRWDQCVWGN